MTGYFMITELISCYLTKTFIENELMKDNMINNKKKIPECTEWNNITYVTATLLRCDHHLVLLKIQLAI